MNVRQFEYLLSVVEHRSFSKAAEHCNITQSTLSTMIRKFEEEIGISIFDRKTSPISITKEGIAIVTQLNRVHVEIQQLQELAQSIKGELSGEINMGIIPTVAPFILPEFLNDFANKFPKVNFTVSEMTTEVIIELLLKREIDIGILALPIEHEMLDEIHLYNEPFFLFDCRKGIKTNKKVNLNSIDFKKFWLLEEGHCLHTQVANICDLKSQVKKENINFDFKTGSIESLTRFVQNNNGITMLPYLSSLSFNAAAKKKVIPFKSPVPVRSIGLLVHKHFVKKKILNLLSDEIQHKIVPLLKNNKNVYVVNPINNN